MSDSNNNSTNAAAQAASRGVLTTLLQRNPLVALGAAFLNPILGLFRPRGRTQVERLKLESFRSGPASAPNGRRYGSTTVASRFHHGNSSRPVAVRQTQKGGLNHG